MFEKWRRPGHAPGRSELKKTTDGLFQHSADPTHTAAGPKRLKGDAIERLACRHLERQGLTLIARNYRSPFGEIDLVMQHAGTLVFVEVRYRQHTRFGLPAETVDARKQARLRATAEHYLQRDSRASNKPCRFDIVAVTQAPDREHLDWLQNAF